MEGSQYGEQMTNNRGGWHPDPEYSRPVTKRDASSGHEELATAELKWWALTYRIAYDNASTVQCTLSS